MNTFSHFILEVTIIQFYFNKKSKSINIRSVTYMTRIYSIIYIHVLTDNKQNDSQASQDRYLFYSYK